MYAISKNKTKKDLFIALAVLAVAAALAVGMILIIRMEPRIIDKAETPGEPANAEAIRGYVAYETPDVCRVKICCEPVLADGYASLYLTSPAGNDVLIRAELYSVKVVTDGETGQATFLPTSCSAKPDSSTPEPMWKR